MAVLVAIAAALAMASLLTVAVERPAMRWLRARYRRGTWSDLGWRRPLAATGILLFSFAGLAHAWHHTHPKPMPAAALTANIYRPDKLTAVPCGFKSTPRPLMILALGQSNAGNHGEPPADENRVPTTFFFEGKCYRTTGPAPGATGKGGNPWTWLGHELNDAMNRSVVFSVLAVDSTRISDWVETGKLREAFLAMLADQRRHGFVPDFVLWQQGEADAKAGTTRAKYLEGFAALVALMRTHGVSAPVIAALSTRCRNKGSRFVRSALEAVTTADASIRIGPDLDTLTGSMRLDDCHFSASGLQAVATHWRDALLDASHSKTLSSSLDTSH